MNEQSKQYQQIIAKCWEDEEFKQRLLDDPMQTLQTEGVQIPADVQVNVVENTATNIYMVIPAQTEVTSEGGSVGEERKAAIF